MGRNIVKTTTYTKLINRFQIDHTKPRKKFICPQCKCKTLTRFIDATTGNYINELYGICDRESKCGYKNIPKHKDFENEDMFIPPVKAKDIFRVIPEGVPNELDAKIVLKHVDNFSQNNLFKFLITKFNYTDVLNTFIKYKIGTTNYPWPGSSIFFQIDQAFAARTGKIMDYNPQTGKRVKADKSHIIWMHTLEGGDYLLKQCLFGEFLINDDVPEYHIVESEKTAIIASIHNPKITVLACGGLNNLREEVMQPLFDYKIILYPDKGKAFNKWTQKVKNELLEYKITISDKLEKNNNLSEGDDLADWILSKK